VEYEGDEPAVKESEGDAETSGNEFGSMNDEELQEELTKAVENEDYERASLIRDEINKRK
jgi:protein-arginine kinase activator protein McsA